MGEKEAILRGIAFFYGVRHHLLQQPGDEALASHITKT